jgi:hypothetical protein
LQFFPGTPGGKELEIATIKKSPRSKKNRTFYKFLVKVFGVSDTPSPYIANDWDNMETGIICLPGTI